MNDLAEKAKRHERPKWDFPRGEYVTASKASQRLGLPLLTIRKWIERYEVAKRQVDRRRFTYDFEHLSELEFEARRKKASRQS